MSAKVVGLGHVGIYVQNLERMTAFYRDFMGMQVTKVNDRMAFLSSDPERSDHEIALMAGRESLEDPHLIDQISLRVETLDDLRDFYRRIQQEGYPIDRLVTHASAIGCYFRDPEGNRTEVFWVTGLPSWVGIGVPIDIERPDEEVMAAPIGPIDLGVEGIKKRAASLAFESPYDALGLREGAATALEEIPSVNTWRVRLTGHSISSDRMLPAVPIALNVFASSPT